PLSALVSFWDISRLRATERVNEHMPIESPSHITLAPPTSPSREMASKYAFSQGLKELRFLFCQTSEHSAPVRNFLTRTYPTMKKHNPHTPIMIREASGTEPTLYARFDFGKEKRVSLKGLDDKAIEQQVTQLAQSTI
ncbi:hypothetical protein IAQ61_009037, partial [Plenodomus lingam]